MITYVPHIRREHNNTDTILSFFNSLDEDQQWLRQAFLSCFGEEDFKGRFLGADGITDLVLDGNNLLIHLEVKQENIL